MSKNSVVKLSATKANPNIENRRNTKSPTIMPIISGIVHKSPTLRAFDTVAITPRPGVIAKISIATKKANML